jgi:hypothetical protein
MYFCRVLVIWDTNVNNKSIIKSLVVYFLQAKNIETNKLMKYSSSWLKVGTDKKGLPAVL